MPLRGPLCALGLGLSLGPGCAAALPDAPSPPFARASVEPGEPAVFGQVRNTRTDAGFGGVLLILTDHATGTTRETLANADGLYRFGPLRPGPYEIRMLYDTNDLRWPVELTVGTQVRVDFAVRTRLPCFTVE